MEIKIDVKTDIAKAFAKYSWLGDEALPKVAAHGMNMTMVTMRANLKREMEAKFDRPTPFTLNGLFTVPAKPQNLAVEIRLKDFAGKGTPAAKYLEAQVYGGRRAYKSFEAGLANAGLLPPSMYAVPAKGAPLDQYGNFRGAFLNRILSYLRANRDATQNRGLGASSRRNAKGKRFAAQYFVRNKPNALGLPLGIYERRGNTSRMIIAFVKAPSFERRLDFFGVAEQTVKRFLAKDIDQAARIALDKGKTSLNAAMQAALSKLATTSRR
jgi:hypothetical protein